MHVAVSVPTVRAIVLSGSGAVTAREIDSPELTLTLSGSGILRAVGAVERLEVSLGGSGDAVLDRLQARDVRARLSGSGRILVQATRSLDASVPGTGTIVYIGDPAHVRTSVTGTGVVARG
jgi:hypothetical protein